ncbi:hypothetical protein BLA29_013438 [Euroglyphus maynei]|uniref:Uncharacterized protein n=1 Tax=Euroglyphus maynei TaxID=6958 RepID=A0A1Y3BP60_EURMA|nr:hypothetical protein BLA29_013438 [Euroglyphus maynei]
MTTTKPETIDITNSPTYQFLQEQRIQQQLRRTPTTSTYSAFNNRTSPDPQQTPYFKTLMNTLNVS